MASDSTGQEVIGGSSLATVKGYLVIAIPDNFDIQDVHMIESELLDHLSLNKRIRGVLVDMTRVSSTDSTDLRRLQDCLLAVRLLGRQVALCGISPGLAALIIRSGQYLHHNVVGADIDDVLKVL
jgi:anti-anti-sigma factor